MIISPLGYVDTNPVVKNFLSTQTQSDARSIVDGRIDESGTNCFLIDHLLHTFPSTTVPQGSLGLIRLLSGTGAGISVTTGVVGVGTISLSTGTTTTGGVYLYSGGLVSLSNTSQISVACKVQLPLLSDATNRYQIYLGFIDGNSIPQNFIGLSLNDTTNQLSPINIQNNINIAITNSVNTTLLANTWYDLKAKLDNGVISYFINENLVGNSTISSVNNLMRYGFLIRKRASTTARTATLDYMSLGFGDLT